MRESPHLLIVEDDATLARTLQRSFERRGYLVRCCHRLADLIGNLVDDPIDCAVVDLKLEDGSGLECVQAIHHRYPGARIVVLTGFASIATAVEAIKLGARHYLPKPANTDDIIAAFEREAGDAAMPLTVRPTSIKNLEWERIHETLVETNFNISETARRLGMHRRTLARKLEKRRVT